jgi:hypothetical protein
MKNYHCCYTKYVTMKMLHLAYSFFPFHNWIDIFFCTDICRDADYSHLRVEMWEKEKWQTAVPDVTTTSCQAAKAAEAGKLWDIGMYFIYYILSNLFRDRMNSFCTKTWTHTKPTIFSCISGSNFKVYITVY